MAGAKSSARARASGSDEIRGVYFAGEMEDLGRHLGVCHALVAVCVEALRSQNADHDAEIALVLQQAVGARLSAQVEKVTALAARFKHSNP